jgi:hypothetical protein
VIARDREITVIELQSLTTDQADNTDQKFFWQFGASATPITGLSVCIHCDVFAFPITRSPDHVRSPDLLRASVPLSFKGFGFSPCLRVSVVGFVSSDRREHIFRAGVIAKGLAHVDEDVLVAGREDKAAAELQWIFAQAMLFVAGGLSTAASLHVVAAQKMEKGSVAQFNRFVGFAFFVDQQWKFDAGFFAEKFGVAHVAQPHGRQARALPAKLFFEFAQLRDVLPAEDSTVMTQKDHDRRPTLPQ